MSTATRESDESKIARYFRQNGTNRLTTNQLRRLADPSKVKSLADQHADVRADHPVTPQAAQKATVKKATTVSEVVVTIASNAHASTWDIDMASKERFEAQKELESARSKINRQARKSGVEVSTQKITREDGTIVLRVHIED